MKPLFLVIVSASIGGRMYASAALAPAAAANNKGNRSTSSTSSANKRITFLRHGCTYMNEYLGKSLSFGEPGFSDIFSPEERSEFYLDSPLSPRGVRQAKELGKSKPSFLTDCELIVTSPLRRALQTAHYGLKPHIADDDDIPVVALAEAAERLYLVSDIGRPVDEIRKEFEYVDFTTGFEDKPKDKWWYRSVGQSYTEWRPSGQGQKYACPGEPEDHFCERMGRLYGWLEDRPENHIAVVCHWGVIDHFTDMGFDNCQWRQLSFNEIQRPTTTILERADVRIR